MRKWLIFIFLTCLITFIYSTDQKTLEYWQKTMKYGISSQRSGVIKSIEDNKVTDAYSFIEDALKNDPNPDIRGEAAYTLISLKVSNESSWLSVLSSESNSDVLRRIVFGISELGIKTAGPKLFDILTNKVKNPKETALTATIIRTLGNIGYKPAGDIILGSLTNTDNPAELRGASAIALGDIGEVKYIPVLQSLLQNTGEIKEVRMYSAYAIGKTGDPQALIILSPFVENENEDLNIRLWSIAGFGYLSGDAVLQKLIGFTKVDNVRIRLEAVKALGILKNNTSAEILTYKALYDPDLTVVKESKKALQNMGIDVENLGKSNTNTSTQSLKTIATNTVNTNKQPVNTNIINTNKPALKSK